MSHENSITIGVDGRFVNIPTVVDGNQLSDDVAIRLFQDGRIQSLNGFFDTMKSAVKAAGSRSRSFDESNNTRQRLEALRQKQGPLDQEGRDDQAFIDDPLGQVLEDRFGPDPDRIARNAEIALQRINPTNSPALDFIEAGSRRFLNNILGIPRAIGTVASAIGAPGKAALRSIPGALGITDDQTPFSERVGQEFARSQQAADIIPRPTAADINAAAIAGVGGVGRLRQGASPDFAGEFETARAGQQARTQQLQVSPGGAAGTIAGDVATLLTGRAPIVRAGAPGRRASRLAQESRLEKAQIPESVRRQTRDVLTDKILPFFRESGAQLKRGGGRIVEASLESATLAVLNDEDPISAGAYAAGAQSAGSLGLFLAARPATRLLGTVGGAALITHMFTAVGPGERNIFESLEFAENKVLAAGALGLFGALAGSGRLRGPTAERFPALFDAITAIPRGALQNRLRALTKEEESGNTLPLKVMQKMASNPDFFSSDQLNSLGRALQSPKAGSFIQEVERLREKSSSFQEKMDDL